MTTAEKLTTIAENEQKVYEAGCKEGNILAKATSWHYMFAENARNELLPYVKYNDTDNVSDMSYAFYQNNNITELPEINTSNVTDFKCFCYEATKLESIPDLDFSKGTVFMCAFDTCRRVHNIPDLDLSSATNLQYMFNLCENSHYYGKLKTGNCTNFYGMFRYCTYTVEVKEIDLTNATNAGYIFHGCVNLHRVYFKGSINVNLNLSASTYLEYDSIMSAINALADRTDTTALTLTLGTTNLAKITDEEKAIATEKGWTLA